jgi:DNA-binding Lrp family transcriptional regulator
VVELSEKEKDVLREIQGDLPLTPKPYAEIGKKTGLAEKEVLAIVGGLMARGIIRRMGAILRHRKAGVKANAMCVWNVPKEEILRVGRLMAEDPGVTHCYHRDPVGHWPYNLYTMIHGETEEDCERIAERLSEKAGIRGYRLLFSTREFKKESLRIF